jgi:hypothetical protein
MPPVIESRRTTIADDNRSALERALVLLEQAASAALADPHVTQVAVRMPIHGRKFGRPVVAIEGHELPG